MKYEQNILIGVVIPTYGRRASLLSTVAMLRAQTWDCWRAVVVDQNPQRVKFPPDRRVAELWEPDRPSLYQARNQGMGYMMNIGVTHLCFWDDDDQIEPDYMAKMIAPFIEDERLCVTCCLVRHKGCVLPRGWTSTPCRMVRVDAIGDKGWVKDSKLVEKAWWPQFDGLPIAYVDEVLVTTGDNPLGGVRHRHATY